MAFTYTGPNTAAEKVRYHIQDTDSGRPLLTDAESATLAASMATPASGVAIGDTQITMAAGSIVQGPIFPFIRAVSDVVDADADGGFTFSVTTQILR